MTPNASNLTPSGEWLTVVQAAAELGLSPSGFRGLAKTEGLKIRRRGNQPGVLRADVDAYLEQARIRPGDVLVGQGRTGRQETHAFVASGPYVPKAVEDVPGLVEATTLRDDHGWTDSDIGRLLDIHYSTVFRRRAKGFSPEQVEAMRQAIIADRGW